MTTVLSSSRLRAVPRQTDTRLQMITAAARLLRRQGYTATGWRQVVAESETPWGSQAHHFPEGKEQLASEAIRLAGAQYERLLRGVLEAEHPADALTGWAEIAAVSLEESRWTDGCPVATVALETAHSSVRLAMACDNAFELWRAALAESMVQRGLDPVKASDLATWVLASIEGALVMARAARSSDPLRVVGRQLHDLLRQHIP